MTIKFHPNLSYLILNKGLLGGFSATVGITVYGGAQPSTAQVTSNWAAYNSNTAHYLAHYTGVGWTHPLDTWTNFIAITTFPTPAVAVHTAEATWCIIWAIEPTGTQLDNITLPMDSFIIAPASSLTGQGAIRFFDPNFVTGISYSIMDGAIGSYIS